MELIDTITEYKNHFKPSLNYPDGYTPEKDLTAIKKQIKEWEIVIDGILHEGNVNLKVEEALENISHEMGAINL